MSPVIMEQPLRRRISSNPRPSGSALAYLLIVLLSAFGITSVAYGFSVLTGLPFLIGVIVAVILYSTKMYFIRHQPLQEQMMSSGWDRVVGYLVTAFFFVALAAYGLYEFSLVKIAASETRQSIQSQTQEPSGQTTGLPPDSSEISAEESSSLESRRRAARADEIRKLLRGEPLAGSENVEKTKPDAASNESSNDNSTGASIGGSIGSLEDFIKATLAQTNNAIGCWLVLCLMEVFIRILVHHNRPRYYYEWE
ncbi:MAG: hypothetical protein ACREAB_06145 [Blastocatellia bacterium]